MNLSDLFADLEADPVESGWQGMTERRLQTNSSCDLFVGIQKPLKLRVIRTGFKVSALPDPYVIPAFRGLNVTERRDFVNGEERLIVSLCAPSPTFNDVFTSLAEDMARHITVQNDEREAAEAFLRRLLQWQRLLQKQAANGLTAEEQRGLWGELQFLRDFAIPHRGTLNAVTSWTGPEAASKDFQFSPMWAAEVKTSLSKQPQMLQIASERQLDDVGLDEFYLVHYSVEAHHGSVDHLPKLVDDLRMLLAANGEALLLFEDKLLEAGYFSVHAPLYQTTGYIRRGTKIYQVSTGFPRIIERDLPTGVGDVKYAVVSSACEPFVLAVAEFIQKITVTD